MRFYLTYMCGVLVWCACMVCVCVHVCGVCACVFACVYRFYISHKRTIEQRILHNKEKQIISKVAEAQRVLMDLNQPKEPLSSDQMVAQPNVDEITGDHVSIQR